MALNDKANDEFDSQLEDEYGFDAHRPPGAEIGGLPIEVDRGSGSCAEDGPLEVAEDHVMMDGEMIGGPAAEDGQSEIGQFAEDGASEIGSYAMHGPTEIGGVPSEIEKAGTVAPFESFMLDPARIGAAAAADREGSEIGQFAEDGASEIGQFAEDGASEIGQFAEDGASEIGGPYAEDGASEIGARAVVAVIEKARDNRQPPPPMRAVDPDEPVDEGDDSWGLTDVFIGAAEATGHPDPFPLTAKLLLRCGGGGEPRYVRVDTEQSYKAFRAENSPEMSELAERVAELQHRLDQHIADPEAHSDLAADIEDLTVLGAEVKDAESAKRVELWMPKRYQGLVTAWREGDFVCASLMLPGQDGEIRVCTSLEPVRKCVAEMGRHASEAGVPASTVVGVLPAMGCVLGAGTVIKEMAAAAPAILQRKEMAGKAPFVVRVEPKVSPALAALAILAWECRNGNAQACDEWKRLSMASHATVRQAMQEALELAKAAA